MKSYGCTNPKCKPVKQADRDFYTDQQGMTYWRGIPQNDPYTCPYCGSKIEE